jgi:HPr kinase/phosphorylase
LTRNELGPKTIPETMTCVAGTCVAIDGRGVLLRGPSGAGKSDLALRLIDSGACLVSDDQTEVVCIDGRLFASAPASIRGLLEVRGLGILTLDWETRVGLHIVIDLGSPASIERFPDDRRCDILGISVPLFRLAPFEASAPAKVRLAAGAAPGRILRHHQ